MKVSVKLQEDDKQGHKHHHLPPLLLRAKIPVTIFNLPFLSHLSTTTTHPSDLSLSLSTNLPSGPSLKLSYSTSSATTPPLSLALRCGTGPFGSPKDSPLLISAHFNFFNPNPSFLLLFKPQLGSFSLRKSIADNNATTQKPPPPSIIQQDPSNSFGFVPLETPVGLPVEKTSVQDSNSFGFVPLEEKTSAQNSIFKGISMMARTQVPVAKRAVLNFRWVVDFQENLDLRMPFLRVNKIGIESVVDEAVEKKKEIDAGNANQVDVLKGMCFWMRKELEVLGRENGEMKRRLEEMKVGRNGGHVLRGWNDQSVEEKAKASSLPGVDSPSLSTGFERWRMKKNGGPEENVNVNRKNDTNKNVDVESELERAIRAASSSSS